MGVGVEIAADDDEVSGISLKGVRRAPGRASCAWNGDRVLRRLYHRLRTEPLRRRVEASINEGTGLSKGEWLLSDLPLDDADISALSEQMIAWCQQRMAESRRPYGIDQMALAVACAVPEGRPLASASFGVFRPVEFYVDGGVADRLGHFLRSVHLDDLNRRQTAVRFAAALFSWGDIARATVFADEAA